MMPLYQLERRLRAFHVEMKRSQIQVTGPDGTARRLYAFETNDGKVFGTRFSRADEQVSQREIDTICRHLGLPEGCA
jgi:hypothetical protein